MTKRLADLIAGFAQVLPIKQVAAIFKVSWDTVKQIDLRAVIRHLKFPTFRHLKFPTVT